MTTTLTVDELERSSDRELGTSAWHEITQDQINTFADATGDHQWIHVDPEKAAAGPFGSTIAHAVSFFASEGAGFVSGQVLYVAGGPTA